MGEDKEKVEEKEKKRDLTNLTDRREYLQGHPELFPGLLREMFLECGERNTRDMGDGRDRVTNLVYHLALEPTTRHEAHWQLQSYVLLEVLQVLRRVEKLLTEGGAGAEKKSNGLRRRRV